MTESFSQQGRNVALGGKWHKKSTDTITILCAELDLNVWHSFCPLLRPHPCSPCQQIFGFFPCCRELWLWVSLRRGEVRVSTGQTQAYSLTLCTLKASDKSHKAPLAPLTWLPTIYVSSGFQCGAKLTTFFFFFLREAGQPESFFSKVTTSECSSCG